MKFKILLQLVEKNLLLLHFKTKIKLILLQTTINLFKLSLKKHTKQKEINN